MRRIVSERFVKAFPFEEGFEETKLNTKPTFFRWMTLDATTFAFDDQKINSGFAKGNRKQL